MLVVAGNFFKRVLAGKELTKLWLNWFVIETENFNIYGFAPLTDFCFFKEKDRFFFVIISIMPK